MAPTYPMTDEEAQRYLAEQAAARAKRPVKSRHAAATIGSKTERGGEVVTASTEIETLVDGKVLRIACVGDTVRYANGSESCIASGAGVCWVYKDKPIAITGSHIANGDTIVASLQSRLQITQFADEPTSAGFLQENYAALHAE